MATDNTRVSDPDLGHLIAWIDEQRRLDHDQLQQLMRIVEHQRDALRDQALLVDQLKAHTTVKPAPDVRPVDDILARLSDHLVLIERALNDHIEKQSRTTQAEAILHDRERRTVAELVHAMDTLNRAVEASASRLPALAEEIRHERDARLPFDQAIEELVRTTTSTQNRVLTLEQTVRRMTSTQSLTDQNDEKRATDVAKLDNTLKLIDIRFSRDIADVRRLADEWKARSDEVLRPLEGIARQLTYLDEQRDVLLGKIDALDQRLTQTGEDLTELIAIEKSDRAAIERLGEAIEGQSRRWETTGSSIWQLGERLTAIVGDVGQVRGGERSLREDVDSLLLQIDRGDEGRRRLDEALAGSATSIRVVDRDAKERLEALSTRVDAEIAALADRAELRYRRAVDHLRRTVEELLQQYRELDAGTS